MQIGEEEYVCVRERQMIRGRQGRGIEMEGVYKELMGCVFLNL